MEPNNPVDTSIKALLHAHPQALFRLCGQEGAPERFRWEDTAINQPELRADHVLVTGTEAEPEQGALYIEYQLAPDTSKVYDWAAKWGALLRKLAYPVTLLVLYLERGDYATFPDRLVINVSSVPTLFVFSTIRLWEHADRIRSGELWELAPLLVLCEDNPTETTMRREVELILSAPLTDAEKGDLLAYALRIGGRDFSRGLLEGIFREMLPMIQGTTIIDDWIAEGEARGEARGRVEEAREMARGLLQKRFGALPEAVVTRVQGLDAPECKRVLERLLDGATLAELFPN
jgi:predicted transposase YdaD